MNTITLRSVLRQLTFVGVSLLTLVAPVPLQAGTPLICHPYAIGNAKSLPGSDGDWKGVNPSYDRANLVRGTLALLTPETPLIVRMETLRRAAIYATAGMRGWSTQAGFNAEDRARCYCADSAGRTLRRIGLPPQGSRSDPCWKQIDWTAVLT